MDNINVASIQAMLIHADPMLSILFSKVPVVNFQEIHKAPYVACIGAIIGQIITYKQAKEIRGKLYTRVGTQFSMSQIQQLIAENFFPTRVQSIVQNLNNYLLSLNNKNKDINILNSEIERTNVSLDLDIDINFDINIDSSNTMNLEQEATNRMNDPSFSLDSLLVVEGIGPWTITVTKLTAFTDMDLFPPEDLFLRKRLAKLICLYNNDVSNNTSKSVTAREALEMSQKWRPYRSIVTWYLWRWFDT
jgi:DNA-3-methyladenine glycosylase II